MKKNLSILFLAALTVGLLGSCSKLNERIDGLDHRVGKIENEKIASIENQIAAINASIADLGTIRNDILNLQVAVGAKGEEISALQAADVALGKRIDELKAYVGDLSKYAEKDWATATFATLEQLGATNKALSALEGLIAELGEAVEASDARIAELDEKLSKSIKSAVSRLNSSISTLENRVSTLEQMIQSVIIVPAYSDGSVKVEGGILTINCVITPKKAVENLTKKDFTIFTSVCEVLTKSALYGTIAIAKDDDLVLDKVNGTATIKVDVSSALPTEEGKALTIAVNIKNGISDYTTNFVPVTDHNDSTFPNRTEQYERENW